MSRDDYNLIREDVNEEDVESEESDQIFSPSLEI